MLQRLGQSQSSRELAALQPSGVKRELVGDARIVGGAEDAVSAGSARRVETGAERGIVGVPQIVVEPVEAERAAEVY